MTISKKLRFEIFKRDNFTCAYCGQTPPTVVLEIDHIEPRSKGGTDDINNLITSCFDCNRGKSDIPLDRIPSTLSDNLEVLKEKEEQMAEYRKFTDQVGRRLKRDINKIAKIYSVQYPGWKLSNNFKNGSLRTFLQLLPFHKVEEAIHIAISKYPSDDYTAIRYFCGICWRMIKGYTKSGKWHG